MMWAIDWNDPQTLWLNLTNIALGVVTVVALCGAIGAVIWELALKHRKAREANGLDAELKAMLDASPHTLAVPGLGLTMADGGEPIAPRHDETPRAKTERGA